MTLKQALSPRARTLSGAAALLLLAGCATTPPPTGLMTRAQQQLASAQKANAADYDPVDLGFAKTRLDMAQAAMANKKYDRARDMANESLVDSRLAQTRAVLAVVNNKIRKQSAENARLRAQLLSKPASAPTQQQQNNNNGGLPSEIVLPQPQAPAPASGASSPTPATSAPARRQGAGQ